MLFNNKYLWNRLSKSSWFAAMRTYVKARPESSWTDCRIKLLLKLHHLILRYSQTCKEAKEYRTVGRQLSDWDDNLTKYRAGDWQRTKSKGQARNKRKMCEDLQVEQRQKKLYRLSPTLLHSLVRER